MSDVKTYSLVGDPHEAGMEEDENLGQWVRIEDFEQLQKENEELASHKEILKASSRILKPELSKLQQENKYWKEFARWVAEELDGGPIYDETWECLQKEFKDCTQKEDFSIKETKRKEIIEKLEQILDILYNE